MGLADKLKAVVEEDEQKIASRQEEFKKHVNWRKEQMDKGGVPEEKRPV